MNDKPISVFDIEGMKPVDPESIRPFMEEMRDHVIPNILSILERRRSAMSAIETEWRKRAEEAEAERDLWLAKHSDCQFVISKLQAQNQKLLELAQLVIEYFGDSEIDPRLDCDIRLRDCARAAVEDKK